MVTAYMKEPSTPTTIRTELMSLNANRPSIIRDRNLVLSSIEQIQLNFRRENMVTPTPPQAPATTALTPRSLADSSDLVEARVSPTDLYLRCMVDEPLR